jgi:hypothetical protein
MSQLRSLADIAQSDAQSGPTQARQRHRPHFEYAAIGDNKPIASQSIPEGDDDAWSFEYLEQESGTDGSKLAAGEPTGQFMSQSDRSPLEGRVRIFSLDVRATDLQRHYGTATRGQIYNTEARSIARKIPSPLTSKGDLCYYVLLGPLTPQAYSRNQGIISQTFMAGIEQPHERVALLLFDYDPATVGSGNLTRSWQTVRDELLARLRSYGRMRHGWDGDDARPISPIAIDQARAFINGFCRKLETFGVQIEPFLPQIDPSPEGLIYLYWDKFESFLSIEFSGGDSIQWYARLAGEAEPMEGKSVTPSETIMPNDLQSLIFGRFFGFRI